MDEATQVRTGFTQRELSIIDGCRGLVKRATWVKARLENILRGKLVMHAKNVQDDSPLERVAFRLEEELLTVLDEQRGGVPRSAWVRDAVLKSISPEETPVTLSLAYHAFMKKQLDSGLTREEANIEWHARKEAQREESRRQRRAARVDARAKAS